MYDVEVRFFTPTKEVPICGHATIAAHYARAVENSMETVRIYQKTGAGILPVDIIKEKDDYRIVMTQGKIEFGDTLTGDILVHGRMFAPAIGISEDPVTGNANGPLGAYLVHYKKVDCTSSRFFFRAMQGEAIHRPGVIDVQVDINNGEPDEVKISGNAVIVFQSEILL